MAAYYNEIDPKAAAWLRELIAQGHIAPGYVDERSIEDVAPEDLAGYTQCHFFAGIGVWSYALRRAGWPDDRPIWTGSCPCQPFSAAGKGDGFADERHLWPAFHHLIEQCRPTVVFGEQVASKDGLGWLDLVQADLEGSGYASGAVDLCAAGVGAPHIRQRLWWVAEALEHATGDGRIERRAEPSRGSLVSGRGLGGMADPGGIGRLGWGATEAGRRPTLAATVGSGTGSGMADSDDAGSQGRDGEHADPGGWQETARHSGPLRAAGLVADTNGRDARAEREQHGGQQRQQPQDGGTGWVALAHDTERRSDAAGGHDSLGSHTGRTQGASDVERRGCDGRPGPTNGFWRDADWLLCRDGKWRPVEPGSFPLAHGAAARVGRLRGYGNAIPSEAAQAFIEAYEESCLMRLLG